MPEDRILHNHRWENLKSYNIVFPNTGKILGSFTKELDYISENVNFNLLVV
jgi:hypothetical protein